MEHKTKVIAFRVNAEEHKALAYLAEKTQMSVGRLVYLAVQSHIGAGNDLISHDEKAQKRKAARIAKKEAQNVVH